MTPPSRTSSPAPASPAFWFGFEVPWAKLVAARVLVFGLLALDALMQLRHAPRYGAGGFNVAQLRWLDDLGPVRSSFAIAQLVNAYAFTLVMFGVATRIALPIATALYAWLYFGSQLDSYQHHYLVAMVLVAACFVPWQRPTDATATTRVASWAVRLILVELGVMYLWAAISKLDPAWLDGRTLAGQFGGPMRKLIEATVGWSAASVIVVITELALACTVWIKRTAWLAAPLGLALHLGIVVTGLEIGLFAWIMLALYALVIPDGVWLALARIAAAAIRVLRLDRVAARVRSAPTGVLAWIAAAFACTGALVCAGVCRFEFTLAVAIAATIAVVGGTLIARALGRSRAATALIIAHAFALAAWLVVDRGSTLAFDYYRFWGGTARRLGDVATAERAYQIATAEFPDEPSGHFQLGRLLLGRNDGDAGLAELHAAQRLDRDHARAFVAEARWLAAHGQRDAALAKAREGWSAEPDDKDVNELIGMLMAGRR